MGSLPQHPRFNAQPACRLLDVASESTALQDAFGLADDVLRQGVQVRG